MKIRSLIICGILLYSLAIQAEVKLPAIFANNMVLQQQSDVQLWGWATAGSNVTIQISWNNKKYTVTTDAKGKWKTKVSTPSAGGPYTMVFREKNVVELKNILVGEVWVCSGQSNMEMPMKGFKGQPAIGTNEVILRSSNKNIRLFTVKRAAKIAPVDDCTGQWSEASPETVSEFSATGYYFGRLLNDILNIPVGLIHVSYSGSNIEAWMSADVLKTFGEVKLPTNADSAKAPNRTPTLLFNGMLTPVIGYGVKGFIWYQGESNYDKPDLYESLFPTMVKEWRQLWGMGDLPFYYAQIAPYNYAQLPPYNKGGKYNSAFLRDAQRKSASVIPNCGMAVLMDIGEENSIHPATKDVGGKRLAYLALGQTYGMKGFGYASPSFESMAIKDTTAVITFQNIPNGLTSFGKELQRFEIAGADKKFYPAKAVLGRKSITVFSSDVKKPVAVRYAFKDFVIGDLFGNDGLPVSSFRTDDWNE
jgi:sialate O-acetylesterase